MKGPLPVPPVVPSSMFLIRNKDFCTLPALPGKRERERVETLIEFLNERRSQNEKREPLVFIYLTALCLSGIFSTLSQPPAARFTQSPLSCPLMLSVLLHRRSRSKSYANCVGFSSARIPRPSTQPDHVYKSFLVMMAQSHSPSHTQQPFL